jgi:hypothetical protein
MNLQKAIGPSIQGQWHGSDAWFRSYLRERSGDAKGYYRGRAGEAALLLRSSDDRRHGAVGIPLKRGETAMKVIVTLLVALSVVTGVAASANAFDAKSFYAQLDRQAS